MAETGSKSPVAKLIDAARQVVQTITPGTPERARPRRRRVIPPTVPPKLREGRGAAVRAARTARETAAKSAEVARDTARRAASTAASGIRETSGAARSGAQTTATAAKADEDTTAEGDRPGPGVPYEEWTKADLYERAQELDVKGRSKMSKDELISALRSRS